MLRRRWRNEMAGALRVMLFGCCAGIGARGVFADTAATVPAHSTLAVLPFAYATPEERELAERMRFAVSQKLSRAGQFERKDDVEVDQMMAALEISAGQAISDDDRARLFASLGVDRVITGGVKERELSLALFGASGLVKTATVTIPPGTESPKLAVEGVLNELTGTAFGHVREVEVDHSDPAREKAFAAGKNLVGDGDFKAAISGADHRAAGWSVVLGAAEEHPELITAKAAETLKENAGAIVGDGEASPYLLLRLNKDVAESNGVACISDWIPVTQGAVYRFACKYRSDGPVTHLFINGYSEMPDKFSSATQPESLRRQTYRYQVSPRGKTDGWQQIEADFTPGTLKAATPAVQWLRVDLYVYLKAGDCAFSDVVVKEIAPAGK
jgi:hypothetical protein